jgi:hypothetical protein
VALLAAAAQPVRVSAVPATLPVAAQQQPVRQYCSGCHNYDDHVGGVEFEVFDAGPLHNI